ncbi:hypothetical protein ES332_D01G037200v1 [Gossypium tomentosum]|uniref:Uncharacterized protein n=1 Tax=Gossypium tomentosum TaxID=34277 RepID=A0A5D2M4Q1_GOSTO|nr:hypothetical protein ES332_D01G037200v1 [Gossypium tomentosum]
MASLRSRFHRPRRFRRRTLRVALGVRRGQRRRQRHAREDEAARVGRGGQRRPRVSLLLLKTFVCGLGLYWAGIIGLWVYFL